jgi:hypothetical protein
VNGRAFPRDYERVASALRGRLGHLQTCPELLDAGEALLQLVWGSSAQLLGEAGARAVLGRSIRTAAARVPLVASIQATDRGVDFTKVRAYLQDAGCDNDEVLSAVTEVGVAVFGTLEQLTGGVISEPLLQRIEAGKL